MSQRHAVCGLLGLAVLCGFSTDVGVLPMLETVSDEPVVAGVCGNWHGNALTWEVTSAPGPWGLEAIPGVADCSGTPCSLDGWRRWTHFQSPSLFEVRNKLWFFNTDSDDPTPGGAEYSGGQGSTEQTRDHNGTATWSRKYTYSRGTGEPSSRGVRATLFWRGQIEAALSLVNVAPDCAVGACAGADAVARMTFETEGLDILATELRKFFENREQEEGMQEWYVPSPTAPETLRRKVKNELTWCSSPTQSGWQFEVQIWPPAFGAGASGPDSNGHLAESKRKVEIDKRIKLCVRPPATPQNGTDPSFVIMVDAEGDTQTQLTRTQLSEAVARVELKMLEIRFERGCVECDPIENGVEIGSTDSGFTAG